jgi:hypothetical protein
MNTKNEFKEKLISNETTAIKINEETFLLQKILSKKLIYPVCIFFAGLDSFFCISNDIKLITPTVLYLKLFKFRYTSTDNDLKR